MQAIRERVAETLGEMEREMRRIGHWTAEPPSAEALASTFPFCYDTLQFQEWLQWVFIPRLGAVLEGRHPLPEKSDMAPLAEVWFQEQGMALEAARLLEIIRELDRLLNARRSAGVRGA
ncbi:MAG TPA: YqcC family protein [Sedimenticola sp.]|nr:YqcC family protein [Sedimenticola sp.]